MTKVKKTSLQISDEIYTEVTQKIIAKLEQGVKPWEKSWLGGAPSIPIRWDGTAYQGINILLLWLAQEDKGYQSNRWLGFSKAKELGGSVRMGEHGTTITFSSPIISKKEEAEAKKEGRKPKAFWLLRSHKVFNTDQIDNLPETYYPKPPVPVTEQIKMERIDRAEAFFKATGSTVKTGRRACYIPSQDYIEMPAFEAFAISGPENYYSTMFHEHVHWTGAEKRLNRDGFTSTTRFGDNAYAMEELVAEMGAAFGCALLEINLGVRDDHADYLGHWLKVLKADNKAIVHAAAHAQKAVKFLSGEREKKPDAEEKEVA